MRVLKVRRWCSDIKEQLLLMRTVTTQAMLE